MLNACIPFYFLIFDENNIPRNERQRGRKLSLQLNSRIECRMGRKNPFCCELMIKWREIRVQRAWCAFLRIVERLDTFISLSLFLCLSLCAFPFRTSVRWWKRGLYCALCSLLKYSRDDCSRRKRNFWLKNGIASRETPLSSVPLNNELQTSASRGESVKNARDEIFLSFLFLFSLFPPPFFFPFLWLGCESKRASIFSDDCEESLKKLFFAGIPCSRFESREAWTSPSPRDENLIKESLLIALRLSNRISTRVRN